MNKIAAARPAPFAPAGRLAQKLARLSGWRRLLLAFVLGAFSALAFAPFYLLVLLPPTFVALLWLLSGAAKGRSAFAIGWAFGVGHFLVGLYWVGIAMTVDFASFWWFLPIAVGGLSLGFALFSGAVSWITWISRAGSLARIGVFCGSWLFFEWVRSWLLTGFPWNLMGTVWAFAPETLQLASIAGVWGLSFITLFAATLPALLGDAGESRRRAYGCVIAALLLVIGNLLFGFLRLSQAPQEIAADAPIVRLVQPSVEQSLKWQNDLRVQHVKQLMALTAEPGLEKVALVVWPETAVPYDLARESELRQAIATITPPNGVLVTGAPRSEPGKGYWNSLLALNPQGEVIATYDKSHLVPFGEYVPFRELLGFLNITITKGSFSAGPGPMTLSLPGLPLAGALICYEVIFSGNIVGEPRPGFLINLTNDAWFGDSSGPYQHLAAARLRAVEEGLAMVRSANNGISAVIDPYGRFVGALPLDWVGILDLPLPASLSQETLYAKMDEWVAAPLILASFAFIFLTPTFRRKK